MIRIYEVYIDVFLAQNVLMDVQLLILTLLLLREKIVVLRLLAASLTGGAGALLILMSGVGYGITYILMVLVLDAVMLFICIRQPIRRGKTFQRLALGIIYLHGMVFAYGKLMECARRLAGERLAQFIVTAVIAGIVIFMLA
ncbi:MAG: sigma-E processing peptidase SpoIIGA, partial [Lachnospiraceae bacterium]|nr:sigma-E processing peptidase SpoIIGA [Lachnospiraceae bacterium]